MFSPFKYVATATSQYAKSALRGRRMNQTVSAIDGLIRKSKTVRWKSDFVEKTLSVSPQRTEEIIDGVFYDKHMRRELKRTVESIWRRGSGAFWDIYLRRISNSVLPFSDDYQSLMQLVNTSFGTEGTIADWNCGPGVLLAALSAAVPERKPVALSTNPRAVIATKKLFRNLFGLGGPLTGKALDFEDELQKIPVADGIILQDTLMLLESESSKIELLQRVAQSLKEGGRLLLIEPKPSLQKQSILRLWLLRVAKSASLNHCPANEHDMALFIEMNRRVYLSGEGVFSSTTELVDIAKKAGFEALLVRDTLYGHYSAVLLKKLPPKPKAEPIIRYHDDPMPQD